MTTRDEVIEQLTAPGCAFELTTETTSAVIANGELWIRGPNVFDGYWDKPEATAD